MFLNDIMTNNAIKDLDFGGRHIDTGTWPKSRINWSPRLGFTFDVLKDKSLIVRGGTGLFVGRLPLVFFTNMPSNAGMNQLLMQVQTRFNATDGTVTSRDERLDLLAGGMITDVDEMIKRMGFQTTVTPDMGSVPSSIAGVDPNFKMPQVWKSAFAVDYQIPVQFPFTVTAEAMYTKNINAVKLENYNVKNPDASWSRFAGPDNRYIYPSDYRYYNNIATACVLTNTNEGYGYTFNLTFNAKPVRNLDLMAAYTRTEMREVSGMPGSNANSAWQGLYTVNGPNVATVQRSQYVVPDQLIGSLSYRLPYLNNAMASTFSLFYRGYSPNSNSFIYSNDINGDALSSDLIYIPKNPGEIKFVDITRTEQDGTITVLHTAQQQSDAFFAFIEQDSYLKKHKGQYAEAYVARAPMVHKFDFRFLQDFRVKAGKTVNTLQFSVDVLNVGNILKSTWGVNKTMQALNNGQILRVAEKGDANNAPSFTMATIQNVLPTKSYDTYLNYNQCWSLQIGLRYIFN
jgi:hypothetical protein